MKVDNRRYVPGYGAGVKLKCWFVFLLSMPLLSRCDRLGVLNQRLEHTRRDFQDNPRLTLPDLDLLATLLKGEWDNYQQNSNDTEILNKTVTTRRSSTISSSPSLQRKTPPAFQMLWKLFEL
jgi:hypothetical protein